MTNYTVGGSRTKPLIVQLAEARTELDQSERRYALLKDQFTTLERKRTTCPHCGRRA